MRFTGLYLVLCCLLLNVDALPFYLDRPGISKSFGGQTRLSNTKRVGCDRIEKYSVDWFINNAPAAKKPKTASCLFYTRGLTLKARNFAHKIANPPKTTIWDVWPGGYYNQRMTTNNPLRCIMQNKKTERRIYFENMSKAFASMCDIYAAVMDESITPWNRMPFNTVNKAGIWFQSEFPTLQKGYMSHKVHLIEAISPDGLTTFPYWTRKGIAAASGDYRGVLSKRGWRDVLGKVGSDGSDWWDEVDVVNDINFEDWSLHAR